MTVNDINNTCASPGCNSRVEQRLACPKCIQLGITITEYFCSQECFRTNYQHHKGVHRLVKQPQSNALQTSSISDGVACPLAAPSKIKLSLPTWAQHYKFTGSLRPALYSSPRRVVPAHIRKPDYADVEAGVSASEEAERRSGQNVIRVYNEQEVNHIRDACRVGREVLDIASAALRPGVTTDEIDRIVHEACIERECFPSPLNYYNFPKSVCTSINEVICHGIPDFREIQNGGKVFVVCLGHYAGSGEYLLTLVPPLLENQDIVNIDVSVYNKAGFHGDLNETFCVGNVDEQGRMLVQTTFESLAAAIELVKPGTLYRDLGFAIDKIARKSKCSVVRNICGHGIGSLFHTTPNIPHYAKNKAKGIMKAGHVFTIEPMINLGSPWDKTWDDQWTVVTTDGKRSAQFEHTILVTDTSYEILTARNSEPLMTWNDDLINRW